MLIPPPPPILFLIVALISGAGALITLSYYQKLGYKDQTAEPEKPKPKESEVKKAVEEAIKPLIEKNTKLEKKLAAAETYFKDLKVARRLAPEPKSEQTQPEEKT